MYPHGKSTSSKAKAGKRRESQTLGNVEENASRPSQSGSSQDPRTANTVRPDSNAIRMMSEDFSRLGTSGEGQHFTNGDTPQGRTPQGNTPQGSSSQRPSVYAVNYDHSKFTLKDAAFFRKPGRVIVVIWSEPADERLAPSTMHVKAGYHGRMVAQKPRYFIVLKAYDQACIAIALHTHRNNGAANVRTPSNHGIAFQKPEDRYPLAGEDGLQPIPIRILPDLNTDQLQRLSRIDYGKIYTVEYNIGVRPFGMVPREYLGALYSQFQTVTGMKIVSPEAVQAVPTASSTSDRSTTTQAAGAGGTALTRDQLRALHARLMSERGLSAEAAADAIRQIVLRQSGQSQRTATRQDDDDDEDDEDDDDDE